MEGCGQTVEELLTAKIAKESREERKEQRTKNKEQRTKEQRAKETTKS
jgi:hypothetical protein